ncbi:MAG: hypothetical protein ACK5SI_17435 [Planctomycetia bacterium]|jgi:hypothetical protein
MSDTALMLLRDTIEILVSKARDAKAEKDASNSDYDIGKLMAFHDVISTIQQQVSAFGLAPEEVGLDKIDPDLELL